MRDSVLLPDSDLATLSRSRARIRRRRRGLLRRIIDALVSAF
jgi:hypothetical protein